ncbi:MAG: anthranilate phosphoribosyltransferase [Gemmatimonadota bacterium]
MLEHAIRRLEAGDSLSAEDARAAFSVLMTGGFEPERAAAFLLALKRKGETAVEIAGGVRALRAALVPVEIPGGPVVDTCGTGGGSLTTFNISTAAALVVAGAGARVAKHGNRSFTSRSGSADVLEALGVAIRVPPELAPAFVERTGFVFLFAPSYHPAMRHVAPVRRDLGVATAMNLLGPLANPAGVRRQVVGVADPDRLDLMAGALCELGHERALVVHGAPGMDECSPLGETSVRVVEHGTVRSHVIRPGDLGYGPFAAEELAGGEPEENARIVEAIVRGELGGAARAAVELNAAAALFAAGVASDLADGVRRAGTAIDGGAAGRVLERLREESRRLSPET